MILKSDFRTQADSIAKGQSQDISNAHVSSLSRTPIMFSVVTVYCLVSHVNVSTYKHMVQLESVM